MYNLFYGLYLNREEVPCGDILLCQWIETRRRKRHQKHEHEEKLKLNFLPSSILVYCHINYTSFALRPTLTPHLMHAKLVTNFFMNQLLLVRWISMNPIVTIINSIYIVSIVVFQKIILLLSFYQHIKKTGVILQLITTSAILISRWIGGKPIWDMSRYVHVLDECSIYII